MGYANYLGRLVRLGGINKVLRPYFGYKMLS